MDERYYNPMDDYENQMRLENGYVQRHKDDFSVYNDLGHNIPNNYGSTTRYNQLQNYPNNLVNRSGQNLPISDYEAQVLLEQTRPNNISDMQQVQRMAARESGLFDLLYRLFSGKGTGSELMYANPIIENKDLVRFQ